MSGADLNPWTVKDGIDREAREAALQAVSQVAVEPTSRVPYRSQGRLLIIGEAAEALAVCETLKEHLHCFVLAQGEGIGRAEGDVPVVFINPSLDLKVTGYLGEFAVDLRSKEHGEINLAQVFEAGFTRFDLILDLGTPPLLGWEMPPFGYYAPQGAAAELQRALAELPGLVGEFEKATFFHYSPDSCAHGRSGLPGCRRCLDACPSGAITSLGDKIAVDPFYCQGAGSCATACPTGAIIYSFPKPADTLNRLRRLLQTYRESGGREPVLLFHDTQAGNKQLAGIRERLPGQLIPIEVEEIGSVGMDIWLASLAYGASRVLLLQTPELPSGVFKELQEQLRFSRALLEGMGYPGTALKLVSASPDDAVLLEEWCKSPSMPPIRPADFAGSNAKRDSLYYAIDALAAQTSRCNDTIALPAHAPFGEIQVDRNACTLCMACVSVCPAKALFDGIDTPRLEFLEASCVQCGLCQAACPEQAVTLHPRFVFNPQRRRQRRVLHEAAPFNCIVCGQPFATRSLIDKMTARLQGHRMFQDTASRRRLQMCGDCRVRDLWGEG
jgi:ferredoxin